VFCTLRTRLHCEVYNGDVKVAEHQAFNEACIDRGPGMYMLLLECYIDGNYVTTIQVCAQEASSTEASTFSQLWIQSIYNLLGSMTNAIEQVKCGANQSALLLTCTS
jgi:hypothetical protein